MLVVSVYPVYQQDMSDDVLLLSSPLSQVNCVVTTITTLSHEVTRPMAATTNSNALEEDVSVDRNESLPYPLRVTGASIGAVCLLAGVIGNLLVLLSVERKSFRKRQQRSPKRRQLTQ